MAKEMGVDAMAGGVVSMRLIHLRDVSLKGKIKPGWVEGGWGIGGGRQNSSVRGMCG